MPVLTREQAFDLLRGERDYQNRLCADEWAHAGFPPIAGELLMMRSYHTKALDTWTNTWGDHAEKATMDIFRKVGGLATRTMENHGGFSRGTDVPTTFVVGSHELANSKPRPPALQQNEVFAIIASERDYQNENYPFVLRTEAELQIVDEYIDRARAAYVDGSAKVLEYLRIIAATVVRAMENHGCPKRE